jgi:hypothetical protein
MNSKTSGVVQYEVKWLQVSKPNEWLNKSDLMGRWSHLIDAFNKDD